MVHDRGALLMMFWRIFVLTRFPRTRSLAVEREMTYGELPVRLLLVEKTVSGDAFGTLKRRRDSCHGQTKARAVSVVAS